MKLFNQRMDENYEKYSELKILFDENSPEGLTYGQINEQSGRVYHFLKENHIGKEDFVLIRLPRGIQSAVAMFGVMKAGAAFVLGEEGMPSERLEYIRRDCNCKFEIHAGNWEEIMKEPFLAGHEDPDEHDAAFAIYTSGTTGNPKGVLHEYGNIDRDLTAQRAVDAPFSEGKESVAIITPLYFIAAVSSFISRLYAGYATYILSYATIKNSVALKCFFEEKHITSAFLSPSYVRAFGRELTSVLKTLSVGSEPVNNLYIEGLTMMNTYSMSECGFLICLFPIDKPYENCPVGKPLFDLKIKLIDENGEEVADGESGELCVEDPFVRGYINLPEQTARVFVDGFYHTGDIARKDENGNYVLLGRNNDMIKINGNRVEPAEIEAAVREVTGLSWAAAKGFTEEGHAYICVYYTDAVTIDENEIRKALADRLPYYMIPAYFIKLDEVPLNQNGKLDRRKLPSPDTSSFRSEYVAPSTQAEELLCRGMAKILKLERVGVNDDFFMIGGDSIKAISLAGECKELGVSVEMIFQGRTLGEIAALAEKNTTKKPVCHKEKRADGYSTLTPSECGMYLEQKMEPESTEYNLNIGIVITGSSQETVEHSVQTILRSHEAFHSYYGDENGVPVRILTDTLPEIRWQDAGSREEVEKIVNTYAVPFDLSKVPLHITAYRIPDGQIILHLAIHHIAFDGASTSVFAEELFRLLRGETIDPAGIDLSEFSCLDRTEEYEEGRRYYREMFADGVPVNEMPVRGVRPKRHPATDSEVNFVIEKKELDAIETAARRARITPFAFYFSAISMVLGKYTGSEDVVIGIPSNMRDQESRNVIGMFVNTAPVRVRPKRSEDLGDYLREVSESILAVTRGASLPFSEVVKEFCQERDASRSPVFDVSVNYLPPVERHEEDGICVDFFAPLQQMKRDMVITLHRDTEQLAFRIQYAAELFADSLVDRFAGQIRHTLNQMSGQGSRTVGEMLALPDHQIAVLERFSVSGQSEIPYRLLHKMFEAAAERTPGRTALIACDKTLTFEELNQTANIIAGNLMAKGVGRGDSVVLLLPRRSFYFAALFGVLKSGAAFIPCDPEYPADRIKHIVADSGARYLVTTGEHMGAYPAGQALDIAGLLVGERKENPEVEMSEKDLAYMIYTSGSTGKPKGVMLRHEGICNFCTTHPANILYETVKEEVETMMAVTTVSFDLSLKDTVGILCNGKTVVFAGEEQMNDPRELVKLFEETNADAINATPSRYLQYLEYEPFCDALAKCRLIMAGGENFPQSLLLKLKAISNARIINTYGPTETTISSNMADLTKADSVTVGRPLLNAREFIVDREGNPVPQGVTGELWIGGPGVAEGYRNLSEMTKEKFITYRGMRVYRSGDYAKWDENGNVCILGRMDNQVKLRGLRIELGEIEGLMEKQPGIRKAVVVIRKVGGQDNLCAYFTADRPVDITNLREELKKSLTHYMIPAAFLQMETIPMTPNGKTDVRALPEPELVQETMTAPANETQQKICDIVMDVIGSGNFGIETDLYLAGLTSLNSVSLSIKLSKEFGVNIQIRDFKEHNTIEKLEGFLKELEPEEEFEVLEEYGITRIQEGIFVETQSHPGTTIYNIPSLIPLDESIDTERLKEAIVAGVNAHPYLKTRMFINEDGQVRQRRMDSAPFTEQDIEEIRCENIDQVKEQLVQPFELTQERLFRVQLIYAERNYLFIDVHHIIFDGTSRVLLMRDISDAYQGIALERETFSGYEAVLLEEKMRKSDHYRKAKEHYAELFEGCDPDCMPLGDVLEEGVSGSGTVFMASPYANAEEILQYCEQNRLSANAFFTAVYGYVLAQYCGKEEAVFTTVYNGRNDPRFAKSVSMYVKTYPVLCRTKDRSIREYVEEVGGQLIDSMNYDVYSFGEISREFGIRADQLFAYQGAFAEEMDFCGAPYRSIELTLNETKANMEFQAYPDGDKLQYYCNFRTEQYTEDFIRRFISVYDRVLTEFMRKERLSEVSLLDTETEKLLDSFHATECAYERTDIVTLFRRMAEKYPSNPAVVYLDRTYTYAQVDELTERIAGYLKAKGIGREDVVSVLIPRCEYIAIASVGVLKAGAAYQPLDPTYPKERIGFMMQDAGTKMLIAEESLLMLAEGYEGEVLLTKDIPALPSCEKMTEDPAPEDLFILLYTSGSTGVPKGVMLEHRNLTAFCHWYQRFYELTPESRVAAYASYGFDADMMDLYPALTAGACVHIIDESIRLDLIALNDYFEQNVITHSFMTTQVGRQFAEVAGNHSLKALSIGGEKLVPVAPPENYHLYNAYGPTECTIFTTIYGIDRLYDRVPIGKALDNVRLYVVDKEGRRLPPLVPGELWVSGHQVGRGYLNRPEQSEKAFIRNPFCREEGYERVYRTGDIVRFLPDGNIDFVGRNDGQVKIRGFRIELPEVERVIRQYPGIKDATVADFDAVGGGKFLAAYVVSDETVDIDKLNDFILERKPPYMVPAAIMQIEKIPLNQNQKVNRRALPEPVFQVQDSEEEVSRPRTKFEESIIEVVKSVVGDLEIGVSASLVNYGLTSINAIGLVTKLSKQFHVELPVVKILDGASIIDIENMIFESWMESAMKGGSGAWAEESKDDLRDAYPLTAVQLGVYYDAMKKEADTLYNIPMCFAFEDISAGKLADSVKAAVKAHSYLNTHIELRDGAFVQVRNDRLEADVPYTEMSEEEFEEYKADFICPFNLQTGPLYRFEIVKTDKKIYLLWDIHHLIFDGFSGGVLLRDIGRAYNGESLEPEEYTYFDYARSEEAKKDSGEYKEAEEYYDRMFKNFEASSEIPGDKAENIETGTLGELFRSIPKAGVDSFCKEAEVTAAAYFLAAVFYTVSRFANSRQVYLSTIDSGRSSVKTVSCLGMFVHTLPLFMNFEEKLSAGELVKRAGGVMRDSIKNEIYPFAEIAAQYGFRTDIMYECQLGVTNAEGSLGGIPYESVRMKLEAPKFKITIAVYENANDYVLSVRYNDALYTEEYMNVLLDSLTTVSETILRNKDAVVNEISIMSAEEKKRVESFGLVKKCDLPHKLLHKAFEATVCRHPDREALIACDRTLTFRELNEMSNSIAWNLLAKGVKRGDSVVLLLPRRSFYFAAAFGVLKTGAAFIPCDPEYPVDRINHIIEDGDARYLITTDGHMADYPADTALDITGLLAGEKKENPDVEVAPDDLAYMIYTSGSTGKPKGVELRHIGICNYINPDEDNLFFNYVEKKLEKIVSVTTISFDMSFKDTVGILCNGKTVVFTDEEQMNDPRALSEILRSSGADAFSATPSRLLQYMEYKPFMEELSKCSLVICGGEAYPKTLLNNLRKLGVPNIFNTYGPTEITVSSNMADLTKAEHVTVGRPLPNYKEYIVDIDGNPVPHGVIGELIIGGLGVARGYHKLPELTAKNFVEYNGERVYRSGDYAKWDADGNVEILGRLDNQIKLRGLRIELGEIEGLIEKQSGIKKAVVVIRKLSGQDNLCAYFTADRQIDIAQLKEELKKHLTHYMVPTAYLQLETIPVTPNGKTNIKALPEPVAAEHGEYSAPENDVEKCFCEIFEKVLKVDRIGAEDDFFRAGGTSLTVTGVVINASEQGYVLNYGDVFKHTTPRALAQLFREDSPKEIMTGNEKFDRYDYSKIDAMLQKNTLSALNSKENREIGDILLTGATGYMGVHVLAEYLRSENGKTYCLVRKGRYKSSRKRLMNTLFYYFGDEFSDIIEERVEAFDGDVTNYGSLEQLKGLQIDTVFNCAASVKHFSNGTEIEDINVGGAKNCVRFCEETGARLIHFSTTSVAGALVLSEKSDGKVLDEQSLYFGQRLDNQYTSSKLLAEREVMEAIVERGLDGKVIRVGTLAARESDGEFQMNYLTNSFMGRLRSYVVLKCFPYSMMNQPLRMGPIDSSAKAFLLLSKTPKECTVFNAINNRSIPTVSVIRVMQKAGMDIRFVENEQFREALLEAEKDPKKAAILQSMLAYTNLNGGASAVPVQVNCEYTTQVLARMGFFWSETGEEYVKRFIDALAGLGFFDETNLNR